ncbi:MAG: hypothetical protein Q8O19_07750 [Rectinemataceae bacterium]|nr:hypothetical protein [Rectinemataceae bacterium]
MPGKCKLDDTYVNLSKHDCLKQGGTWVEEGVPKDDNCFVRDVLTRSLGETILELGTTYNLAVDFRDQVLAPTPIGKRFLSHYYSSLDMTFAAVREDYSLIGTFIDTWFVLLPLVKGILEANGAGNWHGKDEYASHVRFTEALHKRVIDLIDGFRNNAPNRKYVGLLDELVTEIDRYVGLTPYEALEVLRRDIGEAKD